MAEDDGKRDSDFSLTGLPRHLPRDRSASHLSASSHGSGPLPPPVGEELDAFLQRVRLFRMLPTSERSTIAQELVLEEFSQGDAIIRQGESGDSMFIVWSGRAVACFGTRGHEMRNEASYESGDWFGEMALMQPDLKRAVTVKCESDMKVFRLSLVSFQKMRSASRSALRILGCVRYSDVMKLRGAYLVVFFQMGLRLFCAALFWPVVAAWVYRGRSTVAKMSAFLALEPGYETVAFILISGLVAFVLGELLPVIRVGAECVVQIMSLSKLPAWQVTIVDKMADPLMRCCSLGIWCLVIKIVLGSIPTELERLVPGLTVAAPAVRSVAESIADSAEHLWVTLSLTILAGYLLDIKEPPKHIVDGRPSAPGTWAFIVEQYYLALQNPRDFEHEFFADIAGAVNRLLTGIILLGGTLPWFQLLGIQPAQVMTLGSVGTLAFSFASKEVLENLVSGLLLRISKPFMVGDRLRTEDAKYKGIVRKVGMAYSQLTTDDGETLMIPNSVMLKKSTVSMTRRRFRVVQATFPVVLEDFSRLRGLCERIRTCMEKHPDVISGEGLADMKRHDPRLRIFEPQCTFNGYGPQGASIEVLAYTPNIRDPRFMQVRSEILLCVNDQIAQHSGAIGLVAHHIAKPTAEPSHRPEDEGSDPKS